MRMRIFTIVALLVTSVVGYGQKMPMDSETGKITYTEVVQIEGVNKEDILKRAKTWMATGLGSTKSSIQVDDQEGGQLIGKAILPMSVKNPPMGMFEVGVVTYSVTIQAKDGRYKYTFTDFIHDSGGIDRVVSSGPLEADKTSAKIVTNNFPTQYQWKKIKEGTDEVVNKQVIALKKAINKKEAEF